MRGRILRGAWILLALLATVPARLSAQSNTGMQYAPADPQVPLPYGSTRPEDGGFYTGARILLYRLSNPLRQQNVAVRGFVPYDSGATATPGPQLAGTVPPILVGPVTAAPTTPIILDLTSVPSPSIPAGLLPLPPGVVQRVVTLDASRDNGTNITGGVVFNVDLTNVPVGLVPSVRALNVFIQDFTVPGLPTGFTPGQLFGSGTPALDVDQLQRRNPYQPGFEIDLGWKFRDGSSVCLSWLYITETQYRAGATLAPPGPNPGPFLEETFLFSPVFNFPVEYAGAEFKVNPPGGALNPQTVFGIWNGASMMTLVFRQWFQQWEITYREPVWETETYRVNGLVGPRFTWIWEKFKWTTTSIGQNPDGTVLEGPQFVGIYSNITSNRMYGVHAGCEQEWYLGRGFAFHLKTEAALFLDSAKEIAKYETAAKYLGLPQNKSSKVEWAVVPELQASAGLMWYPTEFVQIYAGYDFIAFFNTRASPRPIDFDYSNINPRWTHVNRWIDGVNAGIAFTF